MFFWKNNFQYRCRFYKTQWSFWKIWLWNLWDRSQIHLVRQVQLCYDAFLAAQCCLRRWEEVGFWCRFLGSKGGREGCLVQTQLYTFLKSKLTSQMTIVGKGSNHQPEVLCFDLTLAPRAVFVMKTGWTLKLGFSMVWKIQRSCWLQKKKWVVCCGLVGSTKTEGFPQHFSFPKTSLWPLRCSPGEAPCEVPADWLPIPQRLSGNQLSRREFLSPSLWGNESWTSSATTSGWRRHLAWKSSREKLGIFGMLNKIWWKTNYN